MTSSWARAQDRKRSLIAAGATLALYVLGLLAIVIAGLLVPSPSANAQGPLVVDLGLPEGSVSSLPLGVPAAPERPVGMTPSPPAQAQPQPATSPSASTSLQPAAGTSSQSSQASVASAGSSSSKPGAAAVGTLPKAGGTAPATASAGGAATSSTQAPQTPTTRSFSSSPGSSIQGTAPGLAVGTGTVTFRGSEMGNVLDTTFVAAAGKIGRNLYVPIWLYMPLPAQVSDGIYQHIPADSSGLYSADARKEAFRGFYTQSGGAWNLNKPVGYDSRALLWLMLQDGGYDPSQADFKIGKNLKPVAIDFVVGPASPGSRPALVYLDMVSSSGSKAIDDAVLYGFKQATFFNNTGTSVSGHFTYDFNAAPGK